MDLKSFVAETLTQIVEGVKEAQKRISELGGAGVNPQTVRSSETLGRPTPVEFDVALLVAEETSESLGNNAKASVGFLSVVSAKVSGELESKTAGGQRNEMTSRIKFSVPLALPGDFKNSTPIQMPPGSQVY